MVDFEADVGISTGVGFSAILSAAQVGQPGSSFQERKDCVVTEESEYKAATAEMLQHNEKMKDGKDVVTVSLSEMVKKHEKTDNLLQKCNDFAFRGNLNEAVATDLYCTFGKIYDSVSGKIIIKDEDGKHLTELKGFDEYAETAHVETQSSTGFRVPQRSSTCTSMFLKDPPLREEPSEGGV